MSEANLIWCFIRKQDLRQEDFHDRLKIPYIELRRLYQIDKIASQYRAFGAALGVEFDDEESRKRQKLRWQNLKNFIRMHLFAVGEWMNRNSFELALALVRYGFRVPEIYGTLSGENFIYIKQLAALSGDSIFQSGTDDAVL